MKAINLPKLFPALENNNFDELSLKEMLVLQTIWHCNDLPIAEAFIKRLTDQKESDDSIIHFMLGRAYYCGKGVSQDLNKAIHYYHLSAEKGFAMARNNLSTMYRQGQGIEQNWPKSFTLVQQAAKQDCATAQNNLAILYIWGRILIKLLNGTRKQSTKVI